MPLVVSDANIFVDIEVAGLTRAIFQLPEQFAVPNILYEEELRAHHPDLPGYGLVILDIGAEYVREAERLAGLYRKPGHNDLLALALAKQERCPLLTGDRDLRNAAESEAVIVRGTLWLVEQLLIRNVINYPEAKDAYARMKEQGRRLPWDEVVRQLANYAI